MIIVDDSSDAIGEKSLSSAREQLDAVIKVNFPIQVQFRSCHDYELYNDRHDNVLHSNCNDYVLYREIELTSSF